MPIMNTNRRSFLQTAAAGAVTASMPALWLNQASAQDRPPNIIYVMADDLGYGDLGCYGQTEIQTPNIDRMAREGMRFIQHYSGSTVCAPSRCCLMTGYHTGHCRVRGNKLHPLLPEDVTVAEVLQEAGYATGIVGKWGLGEPETTGLPNRQGFDYWYGFLNQRRAHNYFPDYLWRNEEKDFFDGWPYAHNVFTDEALNFIEDNHQQPFFLYIAYTIPHAFNEGGINGMPIRSQGQYADKDWPWNQRNLAAMISLMDDDMGKIFALLDELGIDDNTIVFFTSDNGPHREGGNNPDFFDSNGPLRGIKRDLYEGGIRTPMIVRWPGHIPAGTVSDQVWTHWDFFPTAADLAGAEIPEGLDGISMKNALLGQAQEDHEFLYWEFHERGFNQAALWQGRWKGVRKNRPDAPLELYDLDNDIGEQNNLADQHPEIVEKLTAYLAQARTESEFYPIPG